MILHYLLFKPQTSSPPSSQLCDSYGGGQWDTKHNKYIRWLWWPFDMTAKRHLPHNSTDTEQMRRKLQTEQWLCNKLGFKMESYNVPPCKIHQGQSVSIKQRWFTAVIINGVISWNFSYSRAVCPHIINCTPSGLSVYLFTHITLLQLTREHSSFCFG